jgi:small ligand-binding sensory domain FIST
MRLEFVNVSQTHSTVVVDGESVTLTMSPRKHPLAVLRSVVEKLSPSPTALVVVGIYNSPKLPIVDIMDKVRSEVPGADPAITDPTHYMAIKVLRR